MNAKRFLTSTLVAAGLVALTAGPALADPPPWAGVWKKKSRDVARHDHRRARQEHRHDRYRGHTGLDRRDLWRYGDLGNAGDPAYSGPACQKVLTKIRRAREGLARWGGTNRHEDAQRDWRRNLSRARHDLQECRARDARRVYDRRDYGPTGYDPYYGDPYYGGYGSGARVGAGFDWKQDWPLLLGPLLSGMGN